MAGEALGGHEGREAEPDSDRRGTPRTGRHVHRTVAEIPGGKETGNDGYAMQNEQKGIYGSV